MDNSPTRKIEFIAKTFADMGKAIFVVGLASYFFERFAFAWRIAISALSIVFIITGILMFPERGDK